MTGEQIAINSVSTAQTGLHELLTAYRAAGFRNIEMPLGNLKSQMQGPDTNAQTVRTLFDDMGLRFIGGFETTVNCFGEGEAQQKNHDLHRRNGELIAALGGTVMVAGTDGPGNSSSGGGRSMDDLRRVGDGFRTVAELLPPTVTLCVEFNWSPLVKSVQSAASVVRHADHPRVGILFDPAHYHCTASKLDDLNTETVPHIAHVHVNDMNGVPGDLANCNSDRVLPGQGVLNLREIFGRLETHGYRGYFSLELFTQAVWDLPVGVAAEQCYTAMQTLL